MEPPDRRLLPLPSLDANKVAHRNNHRASSCSGELNCNRRRALANSNSSNSSNFSSINANSNNTSISVQMQLSSRSMPPHPEDEEGKQNKRRRGRRRRRRGVAAVCSPNDHELPPTYSATPEANQTSHTEWHLNQWLLRVGCNRSLGGGHSSGRWRRSLECKSAGRLQPASSSRASRNLLACLLLVLYYSSIGLPCFVSACQLFQGALALDPSSSVNDDGPQSHVIHVKVGALFEESDYEQANMFIRTIKMINERKDETIRQLLNISNGGIPGHELGRRHLDARHGERLPVLDAAPSASAQRQPRWPSGAAVEEEERMHRGQSKRDIGKPAPVLVKLEPMIEFLSDRQSSFEADCKVCQLIESGAQTVVGPTDGASIQHVQSICDNMEIPYFELRPFLGSVTSASAAAAAASASGAAHSSLSAAATSSSRQQLIDNDGRQYFGAILGQQRAQQQQLDRFITNFNANRSTAANLSSVSASWQLPSQTMQTEEADYLEKTNGQASSAAPLGAQPQQQQQRSRSQHPPQPFPQSSSSKLEDLTLNLYPPAHLLTSAYIDLIYAWNWTSFAIVYEDSSSMIKLQDLFRESSGTWTSKWRIKLFQFDPVLAPTATYETPYRGVSAFRLPADQLAPAAANDNSSRAAPPVDSDSRHPTTGDDGPVLRHRKQARRSTTFRDLFWRIRELGEHNILLDVRTEHLYEALKQAQQVGCMTERYSYLITSLDMHTIDLEDFKYSRTRMSAFSILEVAKSEVAGSNGFNDHQATSGLRVQFDEKYLEKLGVHVIPPHSGNPGELAPASSSAKRPAGRSSGQRLTSDTLARQGSRNYAISGGGSGKMSKYMLSPSVVLERQGSFMEPSGEAYKDWSRREQLLSSPASMGLLPSVDRDNEYKLFEFFLEQQERNLSHVRLSTSAAILHDSLVLYMLGLNELDPSGSILGQQQPIACSLGAQPWPHGSSLVNYMRRMSFTGLTGPISFDQRGLRADFKLNMMGMAPDVGLVKVGEWHSKGAGSGDNRISGSAGSSGGAQLQQQHASDDESKATNSRTYEEQSRFYESELKRYRKLLDDGFKVPVPYTKALLSDGAAAATAAAAGNGNKAGTLRVNEIIYERLYREQEDHVDTLIVSTKLSQPYFMLKETPNKLSGNDQYEGFAVDLIHELSKLVNFKYRWREVADKKYGSKEILPNGTVQWNGMIGEILRGQADLAIVDLTITAQREEAVDFTLPFMNTGISILFKKPTTKVTTLFSFLSPFSSDVWAYVLAAYCGISAILFFVGHLSPYEWADPHPCRHSGGDDDPAAVLKNQFSLLNSFWFTIGSLMQQGSDLTPRSMSTRTIAGIWYFFTLIMISSYTANLAAFLTVEKVVYPIENVRDLSNQQEIRYGCVESGSTCTFFHDSQIDTYKRINETMRKFRTYVRSNDEGQKRVEEGKFAFFMESASIEYIVERNCNLTQIGGLLDSKGYGLATSKKSRLKRPYRTLLSEGILHLQETGMLHILKNRWWKERRGGGTCTDDGKGGGVTELSLANVGGVFVVLLGGLGISFLVAIAEFMWRARRSGSTRDRMCEEMMSDLKFALACKRSMKPTRRLAARPSNNNKWPDRDIAAEGSRGLSRRKARELFMAAGSSAAPDPRMCGGPQQSLHNRRDSRSQRPALSMLLADASGVAHMSAADGLLSYSDGGGAGELAGSKACQNQILLPAMLTMLMQQQQQQQRNQQSGALFGADDAAAASKQVADERQLLLQQQQQCNNKYCHPLDAGQSLQTIASRQQQRFARLPAGGPLFSSPGDNPRQQQAFVPAAPQPDVSPMAGQAQQADMQRRWRLATSSSSSTTHTATRTSDVAAAEKRRLLLLAQQTIDTADDSTFLGQHDATDSQQQASY